jgi:hypothetical protein
MFSPPARTEATPIRLVLIDDDPIFRLGLRTALEAFLTYKLWRKPILEQKL